MNELDDKKYFLSKALVNINTTKIYAWLKYTVNEEKINGGETVLFILGTEWKSGETQHNSKWKIIEKGGRDTYLSVIIFYIIGVKLWHDDIVGDYVTYIFDNILKYVYCGNSDEKIWELVTKNGSLLSLINYLFITN